MSTQDEQSERVAISRSKIGGEAPMVVNEITEGALYTGFFGTLDSARVQIIIERVLEMIVSLEADYVVLDLSNVEGIDTAVAARLLEIAESAELIGANVIFCGIPTVVAQTMVKTGVKITGITTKRSLKTALDHIYSQKGLKLVKGE